MCYMSKLSQRQISLGRGQTYRTAVDGSALEVPSEDGADDGKSSKDERTCCRHLG